MGCTYCYYWRRFCLAMGVTWWGKPAPPHRCLLDDPPEAA